MSGPKNQDKSLHGLSVGLGIAGTIAATVIVFAYSAGSGFSYPPSSTMPIAPSENTAAAANGPALPADDTKQELQLVQNKVQDKVELADKIEIGQQIQQTREVAETQESADINKVDYVPAGEDESDEPSNPAYDDKAQDPAQPANNDEKGLTLPLPTLPLLDGKEGENNAADDHYKKGEAKEHKDKKHDSIASITFKGGKHHKSE